MVQISRHALQRQGLPVAPFQLHTDEKQPVCLNRAPVAQRVKGTVGSCQIFAMLAQAFVHPPAQRFRNSIAKQFQCAQPVFRTDTGLQCAPCGGLGFGRRRNMNQPILRQFDKACQVFAVARITPCLGQIQKNRMPIQRINPLHIPGGGALPVHGTIEMDRTVRLLHLPVVAEHKGVIADLIGSFCGCTGRCRAKLLHGTGCSSRVPCP